jgi:hypothetical protein
MGFGVHCQASPAKPPFLCTVVHILCEGAYEGAGSANSLLKTSLCRVNVTTFSWALGGKPPKTPIWGYELLTLLSPGKLKFDIAVKFTQKLTSLKICLLF